MAATALLAVACGDSSISKTTTKDAACEGTGGCGETGDAGGGSQSDMGPDMEAPGKPCLDNGDCSADQYCEIGSALEGECRSGCHDDSCGAGFSCNASHVCECTGDAACAEGEYCDPASKACVSGCRTEPDTCGEAQACDPSTHTCIELSVCCSADGATCGFASAAETCDGAFIAGLHTCEPNPCGPACQGDGDCAADRFCDANHTCQEGCRAEPEDTCPDGQHCDVSKHECTADEMPPCQTDVDCPDAATFCNAGTGLCDVGCREGVAASCDPGLVCDANHECNPPPPCQADNECGGGQYCDLDFGCRDFCVSNDACNPDEYCDNDPAGGRCIAGCRDDDPNGTDNEIATATALPLVMGHGEHRGALVCPDNPDFYAVELFQGGRIQVDLSFDANLGDAKLVLLDANGQLVDSLGPGSPKRVRYPQAAGQGVPAPGTYYVEVYSQDPASIPYDLSVTVIDVANEGCFPDDLEFVGQGNDNQDHATALDWDGLRPQSFAARGSICGGDEDWWTFPAHDPNSGVSVELLVAGLSGEGVIELYSDAGLRLGLGNTAAASGPGVLTPQGTVRYAVELPAGQNLMTDGQWYVRLRGDTNAAILDDYGLNIQLLPPAGDCAPDAAEPNDRPGAGLAPGANLDNAPGISQGGQIVADRDNCLPVDLTMCPGTEDWFSFTADDGDQIAAWATSGNLAGQITLELTNGQGNRVGQDALITDPAAPRDAATYNGAAPGTYYVHLRSVGAATADPYTLCIRRSPTMMCGADVDEVGVGRMRNDTPATATSLMAVEPTQERFEYNNGVICNVASPDKDWYRVVVPQDNSRICVTSEFDKDAGDLSMRLYSAVNLDINEVPCMVGGDCARVGLPPVCVANWCGCNQDLDCDLDGNRILDPLEGVCIANRCRLPLRESVTTDAPEMIDANRAEVPAGEYYVMVNSDVSDENSYRLNVTVNPPTQHCHADWREQLVPNDNEANATYLGTGEAGVCDAWLCAEDPPGVDERLSGDVYCFDVPAGTNDRTVMLTFSANSDGRALLSVIAPDPVTHMDAYYDYETSAPNPRARDNFSECLNLRGGAQDAHVCLYVTGDVDQTDPNHPNSQIDYGLRILESQLDASADPRGRCNELGGNPTTVWTINL